MHFSAVNRLLVKSVKESKQKTKSTMNYLFYQGMFIQQIFTDKLSLDQQIQVTFMVGNLVMQIVDGITNIQVERDSNNHPAEDQVPPVLLHELVKLKGRDFTCICR